MTTFSLEKHLNETHGRGGIQHYIKELVYGGTDGIITTFAVVAGFAGASNQNTVLPVLTVLLFGFANLFADGVSMALGDYLSSRSEIDVYHKEKEKEHQEIIHNSADEKKETIQILLNKGFTKDQAHTLTDIYMTNPPYWLEFMMKDELELTISGEENIILKALITFFSFIGFGLIPLIPYVFFSHSGNVFYTSIGATFVALSLLGIVRWYITKRSWVRSVLESVILGGSAAFIAYIIGTLFKIG